MGRRVGQLAAVVAVVALPVGCGDESAPIATAQDSTTTAAVSDATITWEPPATTAVPELPPTSGPNGTLPGTEITVPNTTPTPPTLGPESDPYFQSIMAQYGVDIARAQEIARRQGVAETVAIDVAALVGDDWIGAELDPADGVSLHLRVATEAAKALVEAQNPPDWVTVTVES